MLALLQRVSEAHVHVDGCEVGRIGPGLLVFLGIEKADTREKADRLLKKVLSYRLFADEEDKMNLSLQQTGGGLLVISQFTLAADTAKGLRPSFSTAAAPKNAEYLYHYFLEQAEKAHDHVASGTFGADMKVSLTNDGPVTFLLEV